MRELIARLVGERKEWRATEARAAALPEDHRVLCAEIQEYLWTPSPGDGRSITTVLAGLLDLLEPSAADGRRALDVVGPDVAAFRDELLREARTHTQDRRDRLDRTVHDELDGRRDPADDGRAPS